MKRSVYWDETFHTCDSIASIIYTEILYSNLRVILIIKLRYLVKFNVEKAAVLQ
jgi:hypothetical protein